MKNVLTTGHVPTGTISLAPSINVEATPEALKLLNIRLERAMLKVRK